MQIVDLPAGHPAWAQAAPVLQELRTTRTVEELLQVVADGAAQGLRFTGVFDGDTCLGVAGWRVLVTTSALKKLYVDDLVTADAARSRGVGQLLLAHLREHAVSVGCTVLDLDSGVQRHGAHRFYLRERMSIVSHHFALEL